jgi:predicted esterase
MSSFDTQVPSRLARTRPLHGTAAPAVALHGEGHTLDELLDFARLVLPAREVVVPVGAWGTYTGAMDLSGYTWFHEVEGVDAPEPTTVGRSLLDVEQLVLELCESRAAGTRAVLLGTGQGASLALTLAAVIPDLLDAVIAIGGRPLDLPEGAVGTVPESAPVPTLRLEQTPLSPGLGTTIGAWLATEGVS